MRKFCFGLISILIFYSQTSALSISDNIEFFRNRMAKITGQTPPSISSTENLPPKCGTPVTLAIYNAIRNNTQYDAIASTLQRPILPDTFGTAHYLIHYTTISADSVFQPDIDSVPGIPRYVSRVAEVFEHVWNIEIDSLAYNQPPSDQGFGGGDGRYDIYLMNLGFGTFGFTTPESIPNYGQRAASYIVLENDFAETPNHRYNPNYGGDPILAVKVTAAHEFFHAVQFGYDQFEFDFDNPNNPITYKPWWMEASAVWMEDIVYTDINDYIGYLPFFYNYIWMGLGTFSYGGDPRAFHPYASVVWPTFMTEKYSNFDIIRQIWTIDGQVQGYNTLPATNAVLEQFGATLQSAFLEFEVWNFYTGEPNNGGRADTINFYREGNLFNYSNGNPIVADTTAFINNLPSQPSFSIGNLPNPPEDLAANMIIIKSNNLLGGVALNFDGFDAPNSEWHVGILGYRPGASEWSDIHVDPHSGFGLGEWLDWNQDSAIVIIPTVSGLIPDYNAYTYTGLVAYDSSLTGIYSGNNPVIPNSIISKCYPNPFNNSIVIEYILPQKAKVSLKIYDIAGRQIAALTDSDQKAGHHQTIWNAANAVSGLYFYKIIADNLSVSQKIVLMK